MGLYQRVKECPEFTKLWIEQEIDIINRRVPETDEQEREDMLNLARLKEEFASYEVRDEDY